MIFILIHRQLIFYLLCLLLHQFFKVPFTDDLDGALFFGRAQFVAGFLTNYHKLGITANAGSALPPRFWTVSFASSRV